MRLFAKNGYERTSIADIQSATGMAPGSGALYKHFASKEELLRAGLDAFIEEAERGRNIIRHFPDDPREALHMLGAGVLESMARDRDLVRVIWRDLDHFPDLKRQVREKRIQATFPVLAAWLKDQVRRKHLREHDPEAMAAVMLSSLIMYPVFEAVMDAPLGRVSQERFLKSWLDVVLRALLPAGAATTATKRAADRPSRNGRRASAARRRSRKE